MLSIHVVMYGKEIKENEVGMLVNIEIGGVRIDFVMQPFMRMLDLILT